MSGYCGPKIIDDGLIMNLDASDLNSRYGLNYNLLSIANWTVGSGSVTGYSGNGSFAENIRNFNTDPYGNASITWNSVSDGDYSGNGGWNSSQFVVDVSKTHRFSVKCGFDSTQNVNANWYSFKLYDKILSDSEISNNYNMKKTRFCIT